MIESQLRSCAMAMSPKKKRLFTVLFALFLVIDVVLVVYFLQLGSRKPDTQPPSPVASQSQSQAANQKKPPPNKGGDAKTSELLDELLTFAPDHGTKKTIIYAGSELLAVEGASIEEDRATGKVFVRGMRRVETSGGEVMETSADGELTYDPATGKTDITASSMNFKPAPKK
jgi:hypothetical protein